MHHLFAWQENPNSRMSYVTRNTPGAFDNTISFSCNRLQTEYSSKCSCFCNNRAEELKTASPFRTGTRLQVTDITATHNAPWQLINSGRPFLFFLTQTECKRQSLMQKTSLAVCNQSLVPAGHGQSTFTETPAPVNAVWIRLNMA